MDGEVEVGLPERVKAVVAARRAKRLHEEREAKKQEASDQALIAHATTASTQDAGERNGKLALPEQVARLTHVVRKRYLALLCEPEVVSQARAILTTGTAREFVSLLNGLKDLLSPEGVAGQPSLGPVNLRIVNKIPRPAGSPVVDVTPRTAP